MTDWQLLNQYAVHGSEDAFRMLVERHSGLVYHAALRQVRNAHLAEEITQGIFVALAQKAKKFSRRVVLAGWLFQATRYAVSNLAREEIRRQRREQEALMSITESESTASVWAQLSPHLDEALGKLSNPDREAVLIRFFEEKSHKQVADAMGISEAAAKMRVSRAVEKLRLLFAKQGFAVPTAVLLLALSTYGGQAAPVGLNATIAAAAAAGGAPHTTLTLAKGIAKFMAWSKTKTTLVTAIVLLLTGATGSFVVFKLNKWEILPVRFWRASYDRSTPKGALFFMRRALVSGDADGYIDSFQWTTANESLRPSLHTMVLAFGKLRRQLATTFGDVNADVTIRNLAPAVIPEEMIHSAEEQKAASDHVVIALGSKTAKMVTLELIQSEGLWRVRPEGLYGGMSPQAIGDVMTQFANAIDKAIPEIAQGAYPDAYRVQIAIKHEVN